MDVYEQVAESLRIENIDRLPTDEEIAEHRRVMCLEALSIGELEAFRKVYQPGARLRLSAGQDVFIGPHAPPRGGEHIGAMLKARRDSMPCDLPKSVRYITDFSYPAGPHSTRHDF
jgi:hypothetical protein